MVARLSFRERTWVTMDFKGYMRGKALLAVATTIADYAVTFAQTAIPQPAAGVRFRGYVSPKPLLKRRSLAISRH